MRGIGHPTPAKGHAPAALLPAGGQRPALDLPCRTAHRCVERLEELGILDEITGRARNRLYRADEIFPSAGWLFQSMGVQ